MAAWDDRQTWRDRETIQEAALARAGNDWQGRARREAAALLTAANYGPGSGASTYPTLVSLCAIAWLQGFNLGAHETLAQAEQAFQQLKAAL